MGLTATQQKLLHELFNYDAQSITVDYSYDATGELDVDKLVEQKPFWKSIIASTIKKPRKIVINDWTMLKDLDSKQEKLWLLLLEEGFKQGAEFYLWTGQLVKVTSIQEFFTALAKVKSISYQNLLNELPKQKISKDEMIYIDEVTSWNLYDDLIAPVKSKDNYTLFLFREYEGIDKFNELLNTLNPNTELNLHFSGKQQEFALLEQILKSKTSKIRSLEIHIVGMDKASALRNLIQSYPEKFQTIKEVILETDLTEKDDSSIKFYDTVFNAIPNVESLMLNKLKVPHVELANKNLNKLTTLTVESAQINGPVLKSIPISVKKLELIKVSISNWQDEKYQLTNVENVQLNYCSLKSNKLLEAMEIFPNLKRLDLSNLSKLVISKKEFSQLQDKYHNIEVLNNIDIKSDIFKQFTHHESKIKEIQIESMKDVEISELLSKHPEIKKLSINPHPNKRECTGRFLNYHSIKQLESLELNNLDLKGVNLTDFLKNAANLKSLALNNCVNLSIPSDLSSKLKNLEYLYISKETSASLFNKPEEYNDFLHLFPNLKSLIIRDTTFSNKYFVVKQDFPNLTHQEMHHIYEMNTSSSKNLQDFLSATPQMEEMHLLSKVLQYHIHNGVDFKDKNIYLDDKELDCELSDKELAKILPKLRNLEHLMLNFSDDFQGTFINAYKDIIPISKLTLSGVCHNISNIVKLINSIPALKEFSTDHLDDNLWLLHSLKNASNLVKLDLSAAKLSRKTLMSALMYALRTFPYLKSLDFDIEQLTETDINQLLKIENITESMRDELVYLLAEIDANRDRDDTPTGQHIIDDDLPFSISQPTTVDENMLDINNNNFLNMKNLNENALMNSTKQSLNFDSSTKSNSNRNIFARSIFAKKLNLFPEERDYRLKVSSIMEINDPITFPSKTIIEPIAFKQTENVFADYQKYFTTTNNVYHGQMTIDLEKDEWYPLPSLTSQDQLKAIEANRPLIVGYCKENNLYYVKHLDGKPQKNVNISFMINTQEEINHPSLAIYPLESLKKEAKSIFNDFSFDTTTGVFKNNDNHERLMKLPVYERINLLYAYCNFEKVEELDNDKSFKNDIERLNAIINQRKGVCRHRAWAFKAIADNIGVDARIVSNDIHAYVEVFCDNQWIRKDLGGGLSNVQTLDSSAAENIKIEQEINKVIHPPLNENNTPLNEAEQANQPKQDLLQQIGSSSPQFKPLRDDNPFARWNTVKTTATEFNDYMDQLLKQARTLADNKRNILIMLEPEQIEPFYAACSRYFAERGNASFNLNSFQDITEKSIKVAEDGTFKKIPSDLITMLNDAKHDDALIVNWSSYGPADVGQNSIVDDKRKLRSQPINDGVFVINVLDKSKANRMGEDFYSRMRLTSQSPPLTNINQYNELIKLKSPDTEETEHTIKFYDQDWKKELVGNVQLAGKKLHMEKGALIKALNVGAKKITLVNPPDYLPEFRYFISDLLIKRKVTYNGEKIEIPDDFNVEVIRKHYSLNDQNLSVSFTNQINDTDYLINHDTFVNLFSNKRCVDNALFVDDGWLLKHKNKTISLYITENLSIEQWCKIVAKAQEAHCTLEIKCHPSVSIPTLHFQQNTDIIKPQAINENIVVANDLEFAEEFLLKKHPKATVISVNAATLFQDIIESTQLANKNTDDLAFINRESAIWQRLQKGETIILKGNISKQLANKLNTLLLEHPYTYVNGEKIHLKGKLMLLTEKQEILPHIAHENINSDHDHHWQALAAYVKNKEDLALLDEFKQDCHTMEQATGTPFSYGQLRAMYLKLKSGNRSNPFKPYFRLYPDAKLVTAKKIWEGKKPDKNKNIDVLSKRQLKLKHEFETSNYLFIAGPSGVGKTTYMLDYFKEALDIKIHAGIDKIEEWLEKGGALFIDEANIEQEGRWDILEGVFNQTPNILLNGKIYPITDKHKIIFAGNYGHFAGRFKHQFIERHGQVFNFKELPETYLKDFIALPAIKANLPACSAEQAATIADTFLTIYNNVNTLDQNHPLTPRNLKMMVAKLGYYATAHKELLETCSLSELAAFVAVEEVLGAVKEGAKFFDASDLPHLHAEITKRLNNQLKNKYHQFTVTESRKTPTRILNNQILLRESIINNQSPNTILSGILLEGAAGIGKSTMVIELLKSYGYQDATNIDGPVDGRKSYYHLTPTDPGRMEAILTKAFHEGAIVIIDELNSLPLERVINQLLTGKDMADKTATNKGFLLIGTQNPVNFTGRQVLSMALENRFYKIDLPDYNPQELYQICYNLYPNDVLITHIIDDYLTAKEHARLNNLIPAPTPRDLFNHIIQLSLSNVSNVSLNPSSTFYKFQATQPVKASNDPTYTTQRDHKIKQAPEQTELQVKPGKT